MPSNLITGDRQFQLGSTLIGKSPILLVGDGVTGLFDLKPKSEDLVLDSADGSYLGPDYAEGAIVTFSVLVESTTATTSDGMAGQVFGTLAALRSAWAPSLVDVQLFGRLAGVGLFSLWGKPRGLQADLSLAHSGGVPVQLIFQARDSTLTSA